MAAFGQQLPAGGSPNAEVKSRDEVSLIDFPGVDASGRTDSTSGIQNAIDYAIRTGKTLHSPAGVYLISAKSGVGYCLNIVAEVYDNHEDNRPLKPGGLRLLGDGIGRTIFKVTSPAADAFSAASSSKPAYYPFYDLEGFTLIGPDTKSPRTTTSGNGVRFSGINAATVHMKEVYVTNFYGAGSSAIWLDNCEEFSLDHVFAFYSDIGVKITTASNASIADGLVVDANHSFGFWSHNLTGFTCNNCLIQSNEQDGLYLDDATSNAWIAPYFENNNSSGLPDKGAIELRDYVKGNVFVAPALITPRDTIRIESHGLPSRANQFIGGNHSPFSVGTHWITIANPASSGQVWTGFSPWYFGGIGPGSEILLNSGYDDGKGSSTFPWLTLAPRAFSEVRDLCPNAEGSLATIADSTTTLPGEAVAGGGRNHVLAYCDGKRWSVAAGEPIPGATSSPKNGRSALCPAGQHVTGISMSESGALSVTCN